MEKYTLNLDSKIKYKECGSMDKLWKIGIYCRLSKEDGDKDESNSIGSQRKFINSYIINNIENYEVVYNAFYNALSNFTNERNVHFTGKANILKQPEFSTVDDVKNIISKFESKDMVSKIEENDDEVKVYIGSESEIDDNVTVVKTKYNAGGREGTIAVIGPKRMEYDRVVNMLEYLKKNIEGKGKEDELEKK